MIAKVHPKFNLGHLNEYKLMFSMKFSMEKGIIFFLVAGFFLPAINATGFSTYAHAFKQSTQPRIIWPYLIFYWNYLSIKYLKFTRIVLPKCTIVLQKKSKSIFTVEVNARKHQITATVVPFCNTKQTVHRCKCRNWMLVEEMSINSIIKMTLYSEYFPGFFKKRRLLLI